MSLDNKKPSGKLEELRLVVPVDVANKFRQVAKLTKLSTADLFAEMVEAHAHGSLRTP
jgi:hypothetical protein